MIIPCLDTKEEEKSGIMREMRDQISRIDEEYVKEFTRGDRALGFHQGTNSSKRDHFSRFQYESDFGWVKPLWVGLPSLTFNNLVVFMETRSGDGIEAYINFDQTTWLNLKVTLNSLHMCLPKGSN